MSTLAETEFRRVQLVAINVGSASSRWMPMTTTPAKAEQRLIGQAFKALREAARPKITQGDVGRALGMTGAGWQQYEVGAREFTAEKLERALAAVGATWADLDGEKAKILASPGPRGGFEEPRAEFVYDLYGRSRSGEHGAEVYDVGETTRRFDLRQRLGRSIQAVEVSGDSMSPWAESGEIVLFDRDRAPRRGKGCVVEMKSGEAYVRLYEKSDGSNLFVRRLFPNDQIDLLELKNVAGVYPIVLRGD